MCQNIFTVIMTSSVCAREVRSKYVIVVGVYVTFCSSSFQVNKYAQKSVLLTERAVKFIVLIAKQRRRVGGAHLTLLPS